MRGAGRKGLLLRSAAQLPNELRDGRKNRIEDGTAPRAAGD